MEREDSDDNNDAAAAADDDYGVKYTILINHVRNHSLHCL